MSVRGPALEVTETGLKLPIYDYISNAPTSTIDVFTFRVGGASGLIVAVVTVVYTDNTKSVLSTVTKTPQNSGSSL